MRHHNALPGVHHFHWLVHSLLILFHGVQNAQIFFDNPAATFKVLSQYIIQVLFVPPEPFPDGARDGTAVVMHDPAPKASHRWMWVAWFGKYRDAARRWVVSDSERVEQRGRGQFVVRRRNWLGQRGQCLKIVYHPHGGSWRKRIFSWCLSHSRHSNSDYRTHSSALAFHQRPDIRTSPSHKNCDYNAPIGPWGTFRNPTHASGLSAAGLVGFLGSRWSSSLQNIEREQVDMEGIDMGATRHRRPRQSHAQTLPIFVSASNLMPYQVPASIQGLRHESPHLDGKTWCYRWEDGGDTTENLGC